MSGAEAIFAGRIDGGDRALPQALIVLVAGLVSLAAGLVVPEARLAFGLTLTGGILVAAALFFAGLGFHRHGRRRMLVDAAAVLVGADPAPAFVTDDSGSILYRNSAAHERYADRVFDSLPLAFAEMFANPVAMIDRLQSRAGLSGSAREDLVTRRGHLRLTASRLDPRLFLWRTEDLGDRAAATRAADALSLPMLTAGPSGTILFMNDAFRRLTGGRARTLGQIFHDLPLSSGALHRIDTAHGPLDSLVAEVAGSGGRREIYLLPGEPGAARASLVGWHEVEDLPVPLLKISPEGVVLACNREARALLPMPVAAGSRLSELLDGLGRPLIDWVRDTAAGRGNGAPQFLRGAGEHQDFFVRVALSPAGHGDDLHIVAVLNDVTELKSLEAKFVQSQKMQAIGQLAGGVAHDFNNLLTAISGHCDLLLLRHDQTDPEYPDLIQIHQNANRAASLVGQLLAFSRKQNLMPQVLDLRDTLAELTHLLNRLVGEKVSLTLDHDPALAAIRADKRQLEQVIMNLVVNARDAMPAGGAIRIETANLHLSAALERDRATVPAGDYVVVRVIDHGTGIAPERLPKIFEPFYTTKRLGEGTGLGLSTAYGIVKQTGGFIFADSVEGEGTVFSLYFPACNVAAAAEAAGQAAGAQQATFPPAAKTGEDAPSGDDPGLAARIAGLLAKPEAAGGGLQDDAMEQPQPVALRGAAGESLARPTGPAADARLGAGPDGGLARGEAVVENGLGMGASPAADHGAFGLLPRKGDGVVLLVEDEAPVRAFASRALRLRGWSVIEADSAEAALTLLADPRIEVDVFVTDVIMPGKDGPTWVREALVDRPDTRVVFVSGYAEDAFAEQKSLIPHSVFLPKPFSLSELTSTVQAQLH